MGEKEKVDMSCEFIRGLFEAKNTSGRNIYTHFTSATDTTNIIKIFNSVKEFIIKGSLKTGGLI